MVFLRQQRLFLLLLKVDIAQQPEIELPPEPSTQSKRGHSGRSAPTPQIDPQAE